MSFKKQPYVCFNFEITSSFALDGKPGEVFMLPALVQDKGV